MKTYQQILKELLSMSDPDSPDFRDSASDVVEQLWIHAPRIMKDSDTPPFPLEMLLRKTKHRLIEIFGERSERETVSPREAEECMIVNSRIHRATTIEDVAAAIRSCTGLAESKDPWDVIRKVYESFLVSGT